MIPWLPRVTALLILVLLCCPQRGWAHFGLITPSRSMVAAPAAASKADATVQFTIAFIHPFELTGMVMERPDKVEAVVAGQRMDLSASLVAKKYQGAAAWNASYTFTKPGVAQFCVTPKPYYEKAEDKFIIHYAKTVVAAFGNEDGWDAPAGLKTEIIPLTRPFGNYAGNVFQGQVLVNGKPAPGATVEVEYLNDAKRWAAPTEYMVTQAVKADGAGVFTFVCPKAGWWGFAALTDADYTNKHNAQDKPLELGAVIWVEMLEWQPAKGRK